MTIKIDIEILDINHIHCKILIEWLTVSFTEITICCLSSKKSNNNYCDVLLTNDNLYSYVNLIVNVDSFSTNIKVKRTPHIRVHFFMWIIGAISLIYVEN